MLSVLFPALVIQLMVISPSSGQQVDLYLNLQGQFARWLEALYRNSSRDRIRPPLWAAIFPEGPDGSSCCLVGIRRHCVQLLYFIQIRVAVCGRQAVCSDTGRAFAYLPIAI